MQKADEVKEPLQVGKFYLVQTVPPNKRAFWWARNQYVPIIGPLHEDKKIIGFPAQHYHIDWRFVSTEIIDGIVGEYRNVARLYGLVCSIQNCSGPIEYKQRRCRRQFPPHEYFMRHLHRTVEHSWIGKLETAYEKDRLICNVCPHKGVDLSSIATVNGIKSCPGHGLNWNAKTGKMVKHTKLEKVQ